MQFYLKEKVFFRWGQHHPVLNKISMYDLIIFLQFLSELGNIFLIIDLKLFFYRATCGLKIIVDHYIRF